jgi:hypothetical protein
MTSTQQAGANRNLPGSGMPLGVPASPQFALDPRQET